MALCVSVSAPLNCTTAPHRQRWCHEAGDGGGAADMTLLDVAAPMSVVVALAMVCVADQLRAPVMVRRRLLATRAVESTALMDVGRHRMRRC